MEHALLAACRERGLKQWEAAVRADMRETRVSQIIRHGGATADERRRLAEALGVAEHLLFGKEANIAAILATIASEDPKEDPPRFARSNARLKTRVKCSTECGAHEGPPSVPLDDDAVARCGTQNR
jgi:hypothetical protein